MNKRKTTIDDAIIRIDIIENVKIFLDDSYQVRVVTTRLLTNNKK